MQPDAEHQQDDANFRELARHGRIGDKPWGERPDGDAGHQVADKRWQTETRGNKAETEREHEAHGNRGDQYGFVVHVRSPLAPLGGPTGERRAVIPAFGPNCRGEKSVCLSSRW
jgi:hypothetical protein